MSGGPAQPAVLAERVGQSYGRRRALDGIGFEIAAGEIYGFLGPNGGGKTTLFRLLATLLPLAEGRIEVFGHDLAREALAVRRRLGVVFQAPSLDANLTVRENLRYQGNLYGLSGAGLAGRIDAALDRLGLTDRSGDRAGELSGGLKRRVEIAKALLHGPDLLLLDEPSTGLDPGVRRELWDLLEELARESGTTVLLTTHFMEEGDRCHRVALLDQGRIVAEGGPATLKERIGGDVVVLASAQPPLLTEGLHERLGIEATVGDDGLVRFEHERAHEFVGRLVAALPGLIDSVTVSRPTLEDVFLALTGRGLGEVA